MPEELDNIKDRLANDHELNRNKGIERNKVLMDMNLVASSDPSESNRIILKVIIIGFLVMAAYVVSFYI